MEGIFLAGPGALILKLVDEAAFAHDAVLVSDPDRVIRREKRDADQRAIDTGGEAGHEIFKLVRTESCCRSSGLQHPDRILFSSAARGRVRIYAANIPGEHRTPEPGGIGRYRSIAKPAPIRGGSTPTEC